MKIWMLLVAFPFCASAQNWWEAYENELLSQWVESGLASHPNPQIALSSIEVSRAAFQGVRANGKPELDLNLGARVGRERSMYTDRRPGDTDPFYANATLRWEIDLRGRIKAATESAEAGIEMATADLEAVKLLLAGEIIRSCMERDLYGKLLQDYEEMSSLQQSRIRSLENRVRAGLFPENELEVYKAELASIQQQTVKTRASLEKAEAGLRRLVGEKAPEAFPEFHNFPVQTPDLEISADQPMRRPDVLRAWWKWQESRAQNTVSKKDRLPTLALVASAGAEAENAKNIEPWHAWVGPVVSIPLFAPELKAGENRTQAEAQSAEAEFRSASLYALRDLDNARIHVQENQELLHLSERRLASFEKVENSMQRRRSAGLIQQADFLGSSLQRVQVKQSLQEAQHNLLQAHLQWHLAIGGK